MDDFHKQAAMHGLKKMMDGKHFDICALKEALVITGGHLEKKDEAALRLLHCVDWKDMNPDLRKMVFVKIMEVLSDQPLFNTELLSSALDGKSSGIHGRFLN